MPEDELVPAGDAALVKAMLDALPSPTLLIDAQGTVLIVNSAWVAAAALLDDDRVRVGVGANYFDLALRLADDHTNRAMIASLQELSRGERRAVSLDYALPHAGGVFWFHLQASRVGKEGHVVVTHTDVTSRVTAERTAAWQARHDPLTKLPNRTRLHEIIDAELQRPDRPAVAVLFLDVDDFKDVNDSLGHEVGDELLRELAERLKAGTRAEDTVGRLGGDEFVVLCRDCDADGAQALARRCQEAFDRPFLLGGRSLRLTASVGIAGVGPDDRNDAIRSTDLVRDADLAMYAAKAAGRNRFRVFSPDLRAAVQQRLELAAELGDAIAGNQLVLHYQPVLHLPTGQVTAVEALVRWQHPERGLLPPSEFIALAEQHQFIAPLTRWVLAEAAAQAVAWDRSGLPLVVSVNVSAEHFATGTLVADVREALDSVGLSPDRLVVELTETSLAEDPQRAAADLAALRLAGVEVSIDDFGSGFSSLSQLVALPAGVLKIDRSLVDGADGPASQPAAAIAAVVGLARAFGMRTVAEGVETGQQLAVATDLGCTFAQGYLIARPMPADQLTAWMAARLAAQPA
ncbi:MAG TPA: EAL domain-containing protein [Blastococcus sp.]|nr:EAL domain-containing protein [Blastococcus sp.]